MFSVRFIYQFLSFPLFESIGENMCELIRTYVCLRLLYHIAAVLSIGKRIIFSVVIIDFCIVSFVKLCYNIGRNVFIKYSL